MFQLRRIAVSIQDRMLFQRSYSPELLYDPLLPDLPPRKVARSPGRSLSLEGSHPLAIPGSNRLFFREKPSFSPVPAQQFLMGCFANFTEVSM